MYALMNEVARVTTAIAITISAHARNADQSLLLADPDARVSKQKLNHR